MKAVILAGGLGTRLSEETDRIPKPLVEVGGKPILWHIMKNYSQHGITEFIICLGFRGYAIKEYFANYFLHTSNLTLHLRENRAEYHDNSTEPWTVSLIDTGIESMTGGRLRRIRDFLDPDTPFCFTYGDGVGNIDITGLIEFHESHQGLATLTAVQPPGRFGDLSLAGTLVTAFTEKPAKNRGWVSGGFFVLSPRVLDYIEGDHTYWEREPLSRLAQENKLYAYFHEGFWQPMDTPRDRQHLESLWESGLAPWKLW